ncbi:hypothetical protein PYCCODRAFT_1430003 [Trametes coccinea BRFM310]|uniref:Uncharacterized protein n=1 Tax=Trametes coccinea (strain BRFM310) TaxID=1353009 RepID=A0A1Y2J4R8_TRAC3|nr:hypothetical protein PYCCODRAFT_1430003 [Trametes coccinea BRFM310]
MAPRRNRSTSNAQPPSNHQNVLPPSQRTQTPGSVAQRQLGNVMPAVYQSNMKVLLRREPSITGIIDQFSHVCLYNYNGQKWERHGYEGSMFLYEKSSYPTYGFYILNRMGTDDFIRPIYPEDDMEIMGDYLMYRFYPDFTKTRLDLGLPYPIPEEHRATFDEELFRRIPPEEREKERPKKGRSIILGLWMYSTDSREPLKEVMMRLHSYVKRNLPYPEEFKHGSGRPPPNVHLRTPSGSQMPTLDQGVAPQYAHANGTMYHQSQPQLPSMAQAQLASAGAASELDKLFAKLITPSASSQLPTAPSTGPPAGKSINDLFAALGGQTMAASASPQPQPALQPAPAAVPEPPPSRGLALLDSIFASAAGSSVSLSDAAAPSAAVPPHPEEMTIVSPKPTSSALPQILNQDVISTLLGLSDSRASSAAPSSAGSRRSQQRRYEGDNEYSEGDGVSEGVPSRSNTVDADAKARMANVPTFSVQPAASSESEDDGARPTSSRRVPGDVTPRPPAGGMRLPPTSPPHAKQHGPNATASISATNLNGQSNGVIQPGTPSSAPRERPLIPFEANSELWPYPRAPLDDRSFENDDVVELDFTDTRALSDPALFSSRLKEKQKKGKGKKSKKEREADQARERAEIDKSWDMPAANGQDKTAHPHSTTPNASLSTTHANSISAAVDAAKSPKQAKKVSTNGTKDVAAPQSNGHSRNGTLDSVAAKEAVLSAVAAKRVAGGPSIAKNDFVRELLTLIHTDSQFAEGLWKDYLARSA